MTDVIIVGGGAGGCMAAITAAQRGLNTLLFEKNEKIGRKILITGKGRCNVTNNTDLNGLIKNTAVNGKFLYSAYSAFTSQDTMSFFENEGVLLKTERGNRVFPQSDKSMDIIDALFMKMKKCGVKIINKEIKNIIISDGRAEGVVTADGEEYFSDNVIIATGGKSYPQTGSSGDGYAFAEKSGHTITKLSPSLIPFETAESYPKRLQGLSLKNVKLTLTDSKTGKSVYSEQGEMIFTHFGISGPLVLTASTYIKDFEENRYTVSIDLKPALSEQELDKRIQNDFSEFQNKDYLNSLDKLLPKKLIPIFAELSGIDKREKINQFTKENRQKIVKLMKGLPLTIKAERPIEEAIITRGGVSIKEINPKSMESKLVKGLYFAGEILDADAKTGGFNLQIAFSTGFAAGSAVKKGE